MKGRTVLNILTAVLCFVGAFLVSSSVIRSCSGGSASPVTTFDYDEIIEAGYTIASPSRPSPEHSEKIAVLEEAGGVPVIHAVGMTEDSTDVEVIGGIAPDGSRWLQMWVNGERVRMNRLDWYEPAVADLPRREWALIGESSFFDSKLQVGAGIAWQPIRIAGASVGVAVVSDINRLNIVAPRWIAVAGRVGLPLGHTWDIGLTAGWRIAETPGVYAGVGIGIRI